MLKLFSSESLSERQVRNLASTIERNAEIVQKNAEEIREIFEGMGYDFTTKKFISVSSSMFSMLIIDNITKRGYCNKEEALSVFLEEVNKYYLTYVEMEDPFDAGISERNRLKREAAAWAAEKYFEEKPRPEQVDLFYERAEKFVDFLADVDLQEFERSRFF